MKANVRTRVAQDVDLVLKNLQLKIFGQAHDDLLLATDRLFMQYKAKKDRIILKDGLSLRKYYGKTGSVQYYQFLTAK